MGLPGAGKTTLSQELYNNLWRSNHSTHWLNADKIRKEYNDWDFSTEGRFRQALRMRDLAGKSSKYEFVICDFIAPLPQMRDIVDPDYIIWVDTINESVYADTNKVFVFPDKVDVHVNSKNAKYWANVVFNQII